MKPDRFLNKEKKVGGTTSVEILENHYIHPDYISKPCCYEKATDTGLVKIGELVPKQQSFPRFIFRWDERKETLDVDIYVEGKLTNALWDQPGYKGHHPPKKNGSSGRYVLDIWIPLKRIFKGIIDIGLAFELRPRGSALTLQGQVPLLRTGPADPT
jgi:hypothetical protein